MALRAGQLAFGYYLRAFGGRCHVHKFDVVTLGGDRIARMTGFVDADPFPESGLRPSTDPQ